MMLFEMVVGICVCMWCWIVISWGGLEWWEFVEYDVFVLIVGEVIIWVCVVGVNFVDVKYVVLV